MSTLVVFIGSMFIICCYLSWPLVIARSRCWNNRVKVVCVCAASVQFQSRHVC